MKQIKPLVIVLLLAILIVPSVAFASWWNPFSWNWNIFNWFSKPQTSSQTSGLKTYNWTITGDTISFQYPNDWTVEKEYYSTPAEQLAGTSENIGLFIYQTNNKQDNIHIDGRQNSCDSSQSYTRCISTNGHIITINSKNQDISKFNKILSTLKVLTSTPTSSAKSLCDKESDKDACYKKNAIAKNDVSLCDLMSGTIDTWGSLAVYQKNDCYTKIAVTTKSFQICDTKLKSDPMCYNNVAVAIGDVSACDKVPQEGSYRNDCYVKIAQAKKDLSICYKIKNTTGNKYGQDNSFWENEQCYSAVAIAKQDKSICDLIKNSLNLITCVAGTKPQIDFTKISLDTNTWSTYKSEQYGFQFKYPTEFTVVDKIKNGNLLLVIPADFQNDFSVIVNKNADLNFDDREGGMYSYYDSTSNLWMEKANYNGAVANPIKCNKNDSYQQFTTIESDKIPISKIGTNYFINTNKNFGIDISLGVDMQATAEMMNIQNAMINSLQLIGDTKAVEVANCK